MSASRGVAQDQEWWCVFPLEGTRGEQQLAIITKELSGLTTRISSEKLVTYWKEYVYNDVFSANSFRQTNIIVFLFWV